MNEIGILVSSLKKEDQHGDFQALSTVSFFPDPSSMNKDSAGTSWLVKSTKCTGQPCNYLDVDKMGEGSYKFYLTGKTNLGSVIYSNMMTLEIAASCTVTPKNSEIFVVFVRSSVVGNFQTYKLKNNEVFSEVISTAASDTDLFDTTGNGCGTFN